MKHLVGYSGTMLREGGRIAEEVDRELAVTLRLFEQGGRAALDGIIAQNYDVLKQRPSVSSSTKAKLLVGALAGKAVSLFSSGRPRAMSGTSIENAYAFCRDIAKREAKNFYYAFRVLPQPKMDAICAVYAFMRRADDIADDESLTLDARRLAMHQWLSAWRASRQGSDHTDQVFLALGDAQRRYGIADSLLEQLVEGTTMDLNEDLPGTITVHTNSGDARRELQAYETFDDLYRYCYLVASVVGLVCIRIFGYSDAKAELLAEKTGVAFQITNILRDVKEDAERGRIYIPQDMLREFDVTVDDVLSMSSGRTMKPNERAMLVGLSVQAWEYYEAGRELIPLLDPDSRPAMWVLVEIYSGLLAMIDQRQGDVFSSRVSVPTRQKMFALVRGAAMAMRARRS